MRKLLLVVLLGLFVVGTSTPAIAVVVANKEENKPLHQLTATEAAQLIRSGKLSSEKLVTVLLERIKTHKDLNAFLNIDEAATLAAARNADATVKEGKPLGKLHGVPFAIKDNIDVKGLPTTAGTPALEKHRPTQDAEIVAQLKNEGAIILGKSNIHELAFGISGVNPYFGQARNPYNKECFAGGSSSGNGVALAAGLVPVAIGTDTGGSIRIPASFTGIYGYRPSVGRFATTGVVPMSKTKDTTGPMARSVADLILVDAAVNNYDPARIKPVELNGLRIGMPRYAFWEDLDPETQRLTLAALDKVKQAGAVIVEADIPNIDKLDRDVDFPMSLYECKRDFKGFFEPYGIKIEDVVAKIGSPDVKAPFDKFVLGPEAVSDAAYEEVMNKFRPIMVKAYQDYFSGNKVDYIIIPTTVAPAQSISGTEETFELNGKQVSTFATFVKNTSPGSNVGVAGVSLPVGLTQDGLPVGIEIDVLPGDDEKLLGLALALEALFGPVAPPPGF